MIFVSSEKQVKSFDVRLVIIDSLSSLCLSVFDIFTCSMLIKFFFFHFEGEFLLMEAIGKL